MFPGSDAAPPPTEPGAVRDEDPDRQQLQDCGDQPAAAPLAPELRVRIVRDLDAFRGLQQAWDDLIADSAHREPIHSWAWFDTWWRHLRRDGELFVLAAEDDAGRLQVIAPFMRERRRFGIANLGFASNRLSPDNQILVRHGMPFDAAVAVVLRSLAEHRHAWVKAKLANVPAGCDLPRAMALTAGGCGIRLHESMGYQSAYIDLGGTFADYLHRQFGKSRLRGIKQKVRQLTELPGYELQSFERPEDMPRALALAFQVSEGSWKKEEGTDMGGADDLRAFYEEISQRLARRGEVRIRIAMLDGVPIAVHYYLVAGDEVYLIVNDFDERYKQRSPGTVLLFQSIEALFAERRFRKLCFSGYLFDYKKIWASGTDPHINVEMFNARYYSRLIAWVKMNLHARLPGAVDRGY